MTSANLKAGTVSRCGADLHIWGSQHDEHGADYNTLKASPKNGVSDNRECLVDYHVRQEESNEEKVAVLPNRLNFLGITLLFTGRHIQVEGSGGCRNGREIRLTVSR